MIHSSLLSNKKTIIVKGKKYRIPFLSIKNWAILQSIRQQITEKENLSISKDLFKLLWKLTNINGIFIKNNIKYEIIQEFIKINTFETKYKENLTSESVFISDINDYVIGIVDDIADRYKLSPEEVLKMPYIMVMQIQDEIRRKEYIKQYYELKNTLGILQDKSSDVIKMERINNRNRVVLRMNQIKSIINGDKKENYINDNEKNIELLKKIRGVNND